ncbi:Gp19/Gp15/Gp42 family protein [Corynebacterium mastitidis]|uniref:Gp19/Gp15/Gp42 family protein n=1 Tax=Corynebacterium mastitidis TaxID=161890 RepID=UPI000A05001B
MVVSPEDFQDRFPRALSPEEEKRAAVLLGDAEGLIRAEFARRGRSFDTAIRSVWIGLIARRVIIEMVSTAILVGDQAGGRSGSVQSGQVSESWSYGDAGSAMWGAVQLTEGHLRDLGLVARSRGRFPQPPRWPERRCE